MCSWWVLAGWVWIGVVVDGQAGPCMGAVHGMAHGCMGDGGVDDNPAGILALCYSFIACFYTSHIISQTLQKIEFESIFLVMA